MLQRQASIGPGGPQGTAIAIVGLAITPTVNELSVDSTRVAPRRQAPRIWSRLRGAAHGEWGMGLEPLHGTITGLTNRPEWQSQQQFEALCRRWSTVVGPAVAARTRPTGNRQGVLQVAVESGPWAQNLTFERRRILKKIKDELPSPLVDSLRDIQFSTARWDEAIARSPNPVAPPVTGAPAGRVPPSPPSLPVPPAPRPSSQEAFARWAARMQARSQQLPPCPHCHCPTPTAEMDRWNRCGACMRQHWAAQGAALGTPAEPSP